MTGVSEQLQERLSEHGLFIRGVTRLTDVEIEAYGVDPENAEVALVGNIGSSYWPVFSQAPEFNDDAPEPLDRWSRRIGEGIAETLALRALYPFDGPPYYPFQQWAKRAEGLMQSPIGVLIHSEIGLWHSYRFALLGADLGAREAVRETEFPCADCEAKPCLHSCPVDAFDGEEYAVAVCAAYLRSTANAECNQRGCLARYACPVAPDLRYLDAQGSFHLRAFVNTNRDYE